MQRLRIAFMLASVTGLFVPSGCVSEPQDTPNETSDTGSEGDGDGDPGDGDGDGEPGDGDGDGEPGDGDGDGDGEPGDGDGDGAPGDATAGAACDAFANATPVPLIAAASAAEAATASIVPDGSVVYQVTLPEGAAGFIELQIPDWETVQAFFTTADIEYTVTVEDDSQVPFPREPNAACPDAGITDQRFGFPHWTPATVEFAAEGPREVPLMVIQQ